MHAGGFQSARELLGQGRGLLGGVHALLQRRPGRLPALQPLGGLLVLFLGGAGLPFQVGPFAADLGAALFGALRRAEGSQGLAQALLDVGQLLGARFLECRRELSPGGGLGVRGGQVRGGGGAAQFQGGGHQGSAPGPVQQVAHTVPFGCGLVQQGGPPEGLRVAVLQPVEFPRVLGGPPGGGVPALDGGQRVFGDLETLAGRAPGDGRPGADCLGESGIARLVAGHRPGPQVGAVAGGLGEPLGGVQHLLVAGADLGLGGPAALAEQGLDGGEAAGVEEPAEQAAAGRLVGAQELRELPCGSSTTWQNCSRLMPSSCSISSPISWWERLSGSQPSPVCSRSRLWALSLVVPVPRFLGRSCSGRRVISNRRPPAVSSRVTSVGVSAAAWSLRRLVPGAWRGPGTEP